MKDFNKDDEIEEHQKNEKKRQRDQRRLQSEATVACYTLGVAIEQVWCSPVTNDRSTVYKVNLVSCLCC